MPYLCTAGFGTAAVCSLRAWNWNDLIDFEVYPVLKSKQAMEKLGPLL
jgi:hypothetical protein